jgi:hypothetical protein
MYHLQRKVCSFNSKNSCLLGFGHDTVCGGPDTAPPDARTSPQVPTHPHYRGVSPVHRESQHKSHAVSCNVLFGGFSVANLAVIGAAWRPEVLSSPGNSPEPARNTPLEVTRGTKCVRYLPDPLYTTAMPRGMLKRKNLDWAQHFFMGVKPWIKDLTFHVA